MIIIPFYIVISILMAIDVIKGILNYLYNEKHERLPREHNADKFNYNYGKHEGRINNIDINKNRYTKNKIPTDIDVIVIGSGISGLSTAGLLSKVGKRVLVLEQHDKAGGCTHCFEDKGFEFDTGVHYIGNMEKRKAILDLISDEDKLIEWDQLGREDPKNMVYDEICINNLNNKKKIDRYKFRAGKARFIDEMVNQFPEEKEAIIKYVDLVERVANKDEFFLLKIAKPSWIFNWLLRYICKDFFTYINKTTYEVLFELTQNERLISVLCGQYGDVGQTPKKSSFFMHASIAHHYFEGGWYPRGGTNTIPRAIIPVIEKTGGAVLVGKRVDKILVNRNGAYGVKMINGDIIYAKQVVSSVGLYNSIKLISEKKRKKLGKLYDFSKKLKPSLSFIYLFAGFEGTPTELKLPSHNIWHHAGYDFEKNVEDFYQDPFNKPTAAFIGFPCAKDSTWEKRFPNKSNGVFLIDAKYEWVEQWINISKNRRNRDQGYQQWKKIFQNKILDIVYNYYPQLKDKLIYAEIGTPLTFNYYIGSNKGECYGLESSKLRYSSNDLLKPRTCIKNLFLTGIDITTLGFTGGLMSGVLTASDMLGYGSILDVVSGRNLVRDLMNLKKN